MTSGFDLGNKLLIESERLDVFSSGNSYFWLTKEKVSDLVSKMNDWLSKYGVTDVGKVKDQRDLYFRELTRRIQLDIVEWENSFSPTTPDWRKFLEMYSIPFEDVDALEPWLRENMDRARELNEKALNEFSLDKSLLQFRGDIPALTDEARELVGKNIKTLLRFMKERMAEYPGSLEFVKNYRVYVGKDYDSYANHFLKLVSISPFNSVGFFNGKVKLMESDFLDLFIEECMAHGRLFAYLDKVVEKENYFLRKRSFSVYSTIESSANYFVDRFYATFQKDSKVTNGFDFGFDIKKVSKEAQNLFFIKEYNTMLTRFGIVTLCRLGEDAVNEEIEALLPYAPDSAWPRRFVNNRRQKWDKTSKQLEQNEIRRLIYIDRTARRLMDKVDEKDRKAAEELLVSGYWTPAGLRQLFEFQFGVTI